MITYGYSIQGKSHIQRGVVCQDSSKVQRLRANVYMGIVADGVGSAVHSDIGSKMAVDALFAFCNEHIKRGYSIEQMLQVLQQGYEYAFQQIEQYVSTNKQDIAQYDTTLSAVIYDGENIIYGHAGDGGIVMRCQTGEIKALTNRQKGADGVSVRPLRAGSTSWEFGVSQEVAAGVLLVTDGLLDGVIEPSLLNIPKTSTQFIQGNFKKNNVYITVAEFFMNPDVVFNNREIVDPERLMEHYLRGDLSGEDEGNFLQYMKASYTKSFGDKNAEKLCQVIAQYSYAVWALSKVDDDKSFGCVSMPMSKKVKTNVTGYVEGTLKNGKFTDNVTGRFVFQISASVKKQWQTAIVSVPVVFSASGEVSGTASFAVGLDWDNAKITLEGDQSIELTLPKVKLSAGVGIAYVANAALVLL